METRLKFSSELRLVYPERYTSDEGRKVQRMKRCDNKNNNENNRMQIMKTRHSRNSGRKLSGACQKFKQVIRCIPEVQTEGDRMEQIYDTRKKEFKKKLYQKRGGTERKKNFETFEMSTQIGEKH